MSGGSPTAGTWSSSQWRPDNELETDRRISREKICSLLQDRVKLRKPARRSSRGRGQSELGKRRQSESRNCCQRDDKSDEGAFVFIERSTCNASIIGSRLQTVELR
jgi:hypothetical protein